MEIRILTEPDAEAWWQIRLEAIQAQPWAFSKSVAEHRATPVETIAQRFREAPATTFHLGAWEEGKLVGTASFAREAAEKERHKGRIYAVYVAAAHRGRGTGRALLVHLLELAGRDTSLETVLLSVATSQTAAIGMYRSLGFETYGRERRGLKVGDEYVDVEHMVMAVYKDW